MKLKAVALVVLGIGFWSLASAGCSGDSCTELYDELAKCNFGTTSSSSTGTSMDDGPVCDETAAARAKCVLDSQIDVCKRLTDPATKKTYDECQQVTP
jgi:hypothetical protein